MSKRRGARATKAEGPWWSGGLTFTCTSCGDCCRGPEPGFVEVDERQRAAEPHEGPGEPLGRELEGQPGDVHRPGLELHEGLALGVARGGAVGRRRDPEEQEQQREDEPVARGAAPPVGRGLLARQPGRERVGSAVLGELARELIAASDDEGL